MNIIQTLQKWGNSTGVRLPKRVVEAAHLEVNQSVAIEVKNGSIILTPIKELKTPTLAELLTGVTPEIIGGELAWGPDVGAERYE